jgi:hypothetical protein
MQSYHGLSYKRKKKREISFGGSDWNRLVEILRNDPLFSLPVSVPPENVGELGDDEERAATISSERKLATSYDIVFSINLEAAELIKKLGGYVKPFYMQPDKLYLFHGPRKAFYDALRNEGFLPTKLNT